MRTRRHRTIRAWLLPWLLAAQAAFAAGSIDVYALPYRLVDEQGRERHLADWRGKQIVVAMDHSTYSAICSSTGRRLRSVGVAAERLGRDVEFVIIGLEPHKDTPDTWAAYRKDRGIVGENWHFLQASPADTPLVAANLGVNYRYEYDDLLLDLRILRVGPDGRIERVLEGYDTDTDAFFR
ncbi:MAG: SCO family protein [Rhodocyclaceae bacterium]|nr:SCO family protein [Rhodocyclaceae bacterium]